MSEKILIIGRISEDFHLGSMIKRSCESLLVDYDYCDISPNFYSPSTKFLVGKIISKLNSNMPIEWYSYNKLISKKILDIRPSIILITGIFPLKNEVFVNAKIANSKIVNYLTDSPWSRSNFSRYFIGDIKKYDYIFSTKTSIIDSLKKAGAKKVFYLPFGYDPKIHYCNETKVKYNCIFSDVGLIGSADLDRAFFIRKFLKIYKGTLSLYGGYWDKVSDLSRYSKGMVIGDDFCDVIKYTKINLGIVRKSNLDGHSMRTFEIPACGGVGIYEDTKEHRDLFYDYPDLGFFSSPQDLALKCNYLLNEPDVLSQMKMLGVKLIANKQNTYASRLQNIISIVNQ
jgi:spore maturation protein CgeB